MRILGREPALWLSLVATTVRMISAFVIELSTEQQAVVNALATATCGLVIAMMAGDGQVGAILGFIQAAIALAFGFGLELSAEHQAVIMSFVGILAAMFIRTQVTAPVPRERVR